MSAWIAGGVMVVGSLASGIMGAKAAAKEANRKRAAEMSSAKYKYSMIEANTNLQKQVLNEQTKNAQIEVLRAGAEQNRDVKKEVDKATSTLQASSEGLTSGRSGGRAMMNLQMKGAQAVHDSKTQASNQISAMVDQKDKMTNDLNSKLLGAHQELSGVLSTPSQIYQQNVAALVADTAKAGMSGAMMGSSLSAAGGANATGIQATGATTASSGEFGPGTVWDFSSNKF